MIEYVQVARQRLARSVISCFAFFGLIASLGATSEASFIVNGSFESPALSGPSRVAISNLNDWTASGGFLLLERGVNTTSSIAASDGQQFVSFGHSSQFNGRLFQSFSTMIGESYSVTFDVASIQGSASQTLTASAFDDTNNSVIASTNSDVFDRGIWIAGTTLVFTATSAMTRLEFQDTVGSGNANIALDNVVVTSSATTVVPEPSSFALLGIGAAALLIFNRRRRVRI